jgi:hypothetical protein
MELVRKLLLYVEENHSYDSLASSDIQMDGYSQEQIGYHVKMMADGGLIETIDTTGFDSRTHGCFINRITWYGHEFLDSVRDEGVWRHVKSALRPVGTVSFEVIKNLAVAYASKTLGLP